MSVDRYLAGIGLLALVTVPLGVAAVALRSRFLPTWYGARARVAEIVLVLGALTLTAQLLGIAGIFERWTLVIAAMGVGVAGRAFAHRLGPPSPETPDPSASESQDAPDRFRRVATVVALLGAALVLMQWLAPALEASHSGMGRSVDTIWYHGPMAARFAETGSITAVHYFDDNPVTAYFPGGSALPAAEPRIPRARHARGMGHR